MTKLILSTFLLLQPTLGFSQSTALEGSWIFVSKSCSAPPKPQDSANSKPHDLLPSPKIDILTIIDEVPEEHISTIKKRLGLTDRDLDYLQKYIEQFSIQNSIHSLDLHTSIHESIEMSQSKTSTSGFQNQIDTTLRPVRVLSFYEESYSLKIIKPIGSKTCAIDLNGNYITNNQMIGFNQVSSLNECQGLEFNYIEQVWIENPNKNPNDPQIQFEVSPDTLLFKYNNGSNVPCVELWKRNIPIS